MAKKADVKIERSDMSGFDLWLVGLLTREGKLSLAEIAERWKEDTFHNPNGKNGLANRTFDNHKKSIKRTYGMDLVYDRATNTWDLKRGADLTVEEKRFISKLASDFTILAYSDTLQDRVLLSAEPFVNQDFLRRIIDAMKQKVKVRITYQKYTQQQSESTQVFAPYCLKMYRSRWYVLAFCNTGEFRTFALDDRTKIIELTREKFEMPKDFDAQAHFKDAFGIYTGKQVDKVRIKTFGDETHYWRSAPLHPTQKEVVTTDDYSIFELNLIADAPDFKQELFSHSDQIEVLEPSSLREEIIGFIDRMRNIYHPKE